MANGRIAVNKAATSTATLPEVGKIKIGEKATKPKQGGGTTEYPTSLDYFRATGNFAEEFKLAYGDRPKRLTVAFVSDDVSEVCNERYECWNNGKRWGYGDGLNFTVWDVNLKQYVENVPADDPRVTSLKWDAMLTLRFVLLEMRGVLGYWSFSTKGKKTMIPSIVKSFDYVKERANTIVGFPFSLIVEKKKGYSPGDPRNYPVVTLVPNFSEEAIIKVGQYLEAGGQVSKLNTKFIQASNNPDVKQIGSGTEGGTND